MADGIRFIGLISKCFNVSICFTVKEDEIVECTDLNFAIEWNPYKCYIIIIINNLCSVIHIVSSVVVYWSGGSLFLLMVMRILYFAVSVQRYEGNNNSKWNIHEKKRKCNKEFVHSLFGSAAIAARLWQQQTHIHKNDGCFFLFAAGIQFVGLWEDSWSVSHFLKQKMIYCLRLSQII